MGILWKTFVNQTIFDMCGRSASLWTLLALQCGYLVAAVALLNMRDLVI